MTQLRINSPLFFRLKKCAIVRQTYLVSCLLVLATPEPRLFAQSTNLPSATSDIRILRIAGNVEVARAGSATWAPATNNQPLYAGDSVRTRENSSAALTLADTSLVRIAPFTELVIDQPVGRGKQATFSLPRGLMYFFHRDKPSSIRINTRTAAAAIEGTEFNLEATDSDVTILTTLDGIVELSSAKGRTNVLSKEQGIVEPGKAPSKTAVINAVNIIQWTLYYPAVLDLNEVDLPEESSALNQSLTAYREGN
ncbi:MAG TPA: FecR family protein, partial [Candidatus Nitrosotalea sp.]|nr:FecR family protein [Candidatus Nitrosotalea sp.]